MSIVEPERRTPVLTKVDVVVAGGGPAGFGAAVAAARNGADTILLEVLGFLGGGYTAQGVIGYHIDKTYPMKEYEEDRPLIGGIAQESVERMVEMGGTFPPALYAKHFPMTSYPPFEPELLKICMMDMVEESGAKQLLHTLAVDAVVEDNVVKGVIIESKSGRQAILADVVIDCTGDGEVAVAAGCPSEKLRVPRPEETVGDEHLLPYDLRAVIGGVDYEKAKTITPEMLQELRIKAKEMGLPETREVPNRRPGGIPHIPRGAPAWIKIPEWNKYFPWRHEVLMGLQSYWGDCSNAQDLTKGELMDRKALLPIINFAKKYMPGFENCYLIYTFPMIGVRESRRIIGDYILTWEGDIEKQKRHNDVICQARPMAGPAFDVPYRCLTPKNVEGILTSGRCISLGPFPMETWKIALRDEIQCTGLGEAAGTAAALAVKQRVKPRDVDITTLQDTLRKQGLNIPQR